MKICSIDGCNKKHEAKGLCSSHYKKQYYIENKDIMLVKMKTYYQSNKKHLKQYGLEYALKNKEKLRIQRREYSKNHPEIDRNKNRRKRALKRNNGFEKYTEAQVIELYGTNCYLCSMPIDMSASRRCGDPGWQKGLHIEHVVDIALGGPDTLDNVRPAHAICNLTKKPREMV